MKLWLADDQQRACTVVISVDALRCLVAADGRGRIRLGPRHSCQRQTAGSARLRRMHDKGQVVPSRRRATCQTDSDRALGDRESNSPGAQQPPARLKTRREGCRSLIRRVQDTSRSGVELLAHRGGVDNAAGRSGVCPRLVSRSRFRTTQA